MLLALLLLTVAQKDGKSKSKSKPTRRKDGTVCSTLSPPIGADFPFPFDPMSIQRPCEPQLIDINSGKDK